VGWRRQAGPAYQAPRARGRGHAHGARLSGPTWAKLGFLFSREFLIAFLFIFSRVFNSNSNQTCATIQRIFGTQHDATFHESSVLSKIK
jgi:hypothetical protein